ncbi:MAG: class I SAM-dependent methyltransferase [Planctomycetaceae bacterium]
MSTSSSVPDLRDRFAFGENWARFLTTVDEQRIAAAEQSLRTMFDCERLEGLRFLDVGSGSGLFSLAAHRLGATVHSFDYDPQSVACTREMQRRFGASTPAWTIEQGSALDGDYLAKLPAADIVYSWGVLHHTGAMWNGIDLVAGRVAPSGRLWLALYNDQGQISAQWRSVKQLYQWLPRWLRPLLVLLCGLALVIHRVWQTLISMLLQLLTLQNPFSPASRTLQDVTRTDARGMHRWYDLVDWVGGWPFETAKPEDVIRVLRARGYELLDLRTCGGKMGCNEFLFRRVN